MICVIAWMVITVETARIAASIRRKGGHFNTKSMCYRGSEWSILSSNNKHGSRIITIINFVSTLAMFSMMMYVQ